MKDDQLLGMRMSGTHGAVKGRSLSSLLVSQGRAWVSATAGCKTELLAPVWSIVAAPQVQCHIPALMWLPQDTSEGSGRGNFGEKLVSKVLVTGFVA